MAARFAGSTNYDLLPHNLGYSAADCRYCAGSVFGVYDVSMFFVLTGLSVGLAVNHFFGNWVDICKFGVRGYSASGPLYFSTYFF